MSVKTVIGVHPTHIVAFIFSIIVISKSCLLAKVSQDLKQEKYFLQWQNRFFFFYNIAF